MMKRMKRRDFIRAGTLAASVGPSLVSSALGASKRKPNIIFILADDLGYGNLGCYGQKHFETPHLDAMAQEGLRFTDCYSGSTVCAPSRCCLMTGFHTGHARVRGNKRHPLLPEDKTVAEYMKEAGYTTGIIGKWGLAEPGTTGVPNRKGFDFWYGFLNQHYAHNYFPSFLWRNEKRDFFERTTYAHDAFMTETFNFIRQNKDNPFFLYLPYTIPHAFNEGKSQGMTITSDAPYSDKPWPQQDKNYAAMVHRLDSDVGEIIALLKKLDLDDDTIVFFTSDNGPHKEGGHDPYLFDDNGPLRGIKRDLYEGGIRVPMIVRWPGKIKANTTSDEPWAFWDFLPTAVELAGGQAPDAIDGLSMKNALLGKKQASHEYLYWEFHEQGYKQAVRMGDWKAVVNNVDPLELYNLREDIGEQNNLAKEHPDLVAKMKTIMRTARTESPLYPIQRREKRS
jgi:arylsulfatase A-like enzyme